MEWLVGAVRNQTAMMQALAMQNAEIRALIHARMRMQITDMMRRGSPVRAAFIVSAVLIPITPENVGRSDR